MKGDKETGQGETTGEKPSGLEDVESESKTGEEKESGHVESEQEAREKQRGAQKVWKEQEREVREGGSTAQRTGEASDGRKAPASARMKKSADRTSYAEKKREESARGA